MTEEQQATQELLLSPERFKTADEMVALHLRMAMNGEALRPTNLELPEVEAEQLTHLNQTIAIAANGSTKGRVGYWENEWQKMVTQDESLATLDEKGKLEKEKAVWVKKMIQDFKSAVNKDHVNRLKSKGIGGINLDEFSAETANQIYQRYFEDQDQGDTVEVVVITQNGQEKTYVPSALNKFLNDVIETYHGNYDEIVQDLDTLEWYAGIFGSATKEEQLSAALLAAEGKEVPKQVHANEVIKELIHTKIKLADAAKKQELINQANETKDINGTPTTRPNWLNEKEDPILDWLHQASLLETRRITRKPVVVQLEETKPTTQPPHPEPTIASEPEPLTLAEAKPPSVKKVEPSVIVDELRGNNIQAADTFIETLRDRKNWKPYGTDYWKTVGGLHISKDREWFTAAQGGDLDGSINGEAAKRYQLPLAIYMPGNHGMLITKGPYQQLDGHWYINVWNPFYKGTQPIKLEKRYDDSQKNFANLIDDHIYPNSLFIQQMAQPSENDLEALFDDPGLQIFLEALGDEKLNERQKDALNCLPYCLLIGGYLNALKAGHTPFKDRGIQG